MKRQFGQTGFHATVVGLGAWPIGQKRTDAGIAGSYGSVDPAAGQRVVERYVDLGGTFIDTARAYGTSEEIIGRCAFMRQKRESVFVATKTGKTGSREAFALIEDEITTSLRNLNTDYVDLYQIHAPPEDPALIDELLDIFEGLRERGLIRAIGASVKGPDVTPATVELAKRYVDTGRVDALQLIYSMFRRAHEETFAYAAERGVAIIARTVLESGFLTGKYRASDAFSGDPICRGGTPMRSPTPTRFSMAIRSTTADGFMIAWVSFTKFPSTSHQPSLRSLPSDRWSDS